MYRSTSLAKRSHEVCNLIGVRLRGAWLKVCGKKAIDYLILICCFFLIWWFFFLQAGSKIRPQRGAAKKRQHSEEEDEEEEEDFEEDEEEEDDESDSDAGKKSKRKRRSKKDDEEKEDEEDDDSDDNSYNESGETPKEYTVSRSNPVIVVGCNTLKTWSVTLMLLAVGLVCSCKSWPWI